MKGRKRHLLVDSNGLLLALHITPANVQDGHAARPLLAQAKARHPGLTAVVGDQLYGGPVVTTAMAEISTDWQPITVRPPPGQKGFQPLPRRWVVERSFAWLARCRRLTRDYERTTRSAAAFVLLAMTRIMIRRLARHHTTQTNTPGPLPG